jgi:6-phosphogluconolactonase (cycloisomerase 2 family)
MRMILAAALAVLAVRPAEARMERAYIGTFTNTSGGRVGQLGPRGEGIYLTEIDSDTGRMTTPRLVAKTPSPTWLVADPARGVLYACNYYHGFADPAQPRGAGAISAFRIDKASGDLTLINQVSVGDAPAQAALDPSGKWLVAANYDYGSAAVVPVAADGRLGAYTDLVKPQGPAGPGQAADTPPGNLATSGHDHSRMHGVVFDPSGKYVILDDAGLDRISVFTLDNAGKLEKVADYPQAAGSAPRHSIFGGGGRILYTLFEQNAKIAVSDFDPATGRVRQRQMVSMLPPGFAGSVSGAELLLSKDGRDIYASGRFHDVIVHFRVGKDGLLTYVGEVPAQTNFVRGLAADPSGGLLLAMGQYGDNVVAFRRDAKTGAPLPLNLYAPVPSPVAMVFADPGP